MQVPVFGVSARQSFSPADEPNDLAGPNMMSLISFACLHCSLCRMLVVQWLLRGGMGELIEKRHLEY